MGTTRRAHGEGSIHLRSDGRWAGVLDLGTGPDGKRRRRTVYGSTKKEVSEKLAALRGQAQAGELPAAGRLTVAQWFDEWLRYVRARRPRTYTGYESYIRLYWRDAIGHLQLKSLTPSIIRQHLEHLRTHPGRKGRPLSQRTLAHAYNVLRNCLNEAVQMEKLARNPVLKVKAPTVDKKPLMVWGWEQVQAFLAHLDGHRLQPLYAAGFFTGLRQEELLALRWQDLDLDRGLLFVRQTINWRVDNPPTFEPTKNHRSMRPVTLPGVLVTVLRRHRQAQLEEKLRSRPIWQESDLLFTMEDGRPVREDHMTKFLQRTARQAGLPPLDSRRLRHTHGTLLLELGVPDKAAAERLGHTSVRMFQDIYSQVRPQLAEGVADKLDALAKGQAGRKSAVRKR